MQQRAGVKGPRPQHSLMSTQTTHASNGIFRPVTGSLGAAACRAPIIAPRVEPLHVETLCPWKRTRAMPTPCHLGPDRILGAQLVPSGVEDGDERGGRPPSSSGETTGTRTKGKEWASGELPPPSPEAAAPESQGSRRAAGSVARMRLQRGSTQARNQQGRRAPLAGGVENNR